uniref:DEAD/DEAH box helicase n=1 Tax=Coccidioides posadasii RMSCC 3488 TaxID=454284 RepID=A0A0J6FMP9_COCPO|nr:DEAD/DEAH box helicase [Coccidioides posadasii RMSCC 3488]
MRRRHVLLAWYANLWSRTVDLVGDYAGDELFIIEGDSLLLHVFSDKQLDFNPGFQLLHATYILEKFLQGLHQRKCNFHLVFFKEHAQLCVPPNATRDVYCKCLLAREAIVQHLQGNLSTAVPSIKVKLFDSYWSTDFLNYLTTSATYFIMCHDGAFSKMVPGHGSSSGSVDDNQDDDNDGDDVVEELDDETGILSLVESPDADGSEEIDDEDASDKSSIQGPIHALGFRYMINWFVGRGYNIALVNGIECRDTKVMAMIIEGNSLVAKKISRRLAGETLHSDSRFEDADSDSDLEPNSAREIPFLQLTRSSPAEIFEQLGSSENREIIQKLLDSVDRYQGAGLSQRELVLIVTLSLMFKSGLLSAGETKASCALILHAALMHECRLTDRVVKPADIVTGSHYFESFVGAAHMVLTSNSWRKVVTDNFIRCDLADLIDGRLFFHSLGRHATRASFEPSVISKFDTLASCLERLCGVCLQLEPLALGDQATKQELEKGKTVPTDKSTKPVLPFSHPVFNTHLAPVHLLLDKSEDPNMKKETFRVFKELSHWHNHHHAVGGKSNAMKMTEKQAFFAKRRNQFFMAEMRDYAASLTNATGGLLEPETVFVRSGKDTKPKPSSSSKAIEHPPPKFKEKKGSTKSSAKNKPSVKDVAAAANEKKRSEMVEKQIQIWIAMKAIFDKETQPATRFLKAKQYLATRPSHKRAIIQAEVSIYLLSILVELWIAKCVAGERRRFLHIAAFIWDMVCSMAKMKEAITLEIASYLTNTIKALGLPAELDIHPGRKLSKSSVSSPVFPSGKVGSLDIGLSPTEFQLLHAAPFLDRNMGSAPDPRVRDFEPDEWQRKVLDEIDAKRSLFVVAPTSAGKTFISFYAMKKVLEDDDDGVLVYVAPTKALVNQIAAEIQARFSKSFKHGGKSVWGIHTRDYRINNPTGCQVLVTVPHILQIMLLSPANATSWSSRVKRIIFDEVHCIGQVDDGVVWEQLLLLAPCPIIALSATIGNPQKFCKWLQMTQKANGIDLTMIEHSHRYSDLRKYVYKPPKRFLFNGLPASVPFAPPGLDNAAGMAFMHPVASLVVDRLRGMPDDLTLEARDCWMLWRAMMKYQSQDFPVEKYLDPAVALPNVIRKVDIVHWEAKLKALLKTWIEDPKSPFEMVLGDLEHSVRAASRPEVQISSGKITTSENPRKVIARHYLNTTLPLACSLHEQGGLPALFFNYDRSGCEDMCRHLLEQLENAEKQWKDSSSAWKDKLAGWEAWKSSEEKLAKKNPAEAKKKGKRKDEGDGISQEDRMRETLSPETSSYELFDPTAPVDGFHFADLKKLTPSEFDEYAFRLRGRSDEWLIKALRRGIGVHHAGMNRKYRQVCEMLFRKGYLRVVIATGTLALGINMPCKTVVFSGDSVFLTALNFRQAAGRAGRRGFDMLGNVVFQGLPYSKVCHLLSSKLPDLNGHFPITTSLVLRLFALLHESKLAPNAVKMINSVLSSARIYLGGGEAKHSVLHHLRFSIEYLRRSHLLGPTGVPLNFAGCVSHLYFVENASFAFHALLKGGYFHRLCEDVNRRPKVILLNMMLVMSHLFGRRWIRPSILENLKMASKKSTSLVVLPHLPPEAAKILKQSNQETLSIYSSYVKTFVDQHISETDCNLPLTGMKCGGDRSLESLKTPFSRPVRYISAFYALSGHEDNWETIADLCTTVRNGVWLEKTVVPYVGVFPDEEGQLPLNAYLYDFYKHGNDQALEKYNGIRKGDIWFVLNDFSLVLATIVTSFENLLKLSPVVDADMLDVMGTGDANEEELDVETIQNEASNVPTGKPNPTDLPTGQAPSTTSASSAIVAVPRRKAVADSWEDEAEGNEEEEETSKLVESKSKKKENDLEDWRRARDEVSMSAIGGKDERILNVLKSFKLLQTEFNQKFKEMWA